MEVICVLLRIYAIVVEHNIHRKSELKIWRQPLQEIQFGPTITKGISKNQT